MTVTTDDVVQITFLGKDDKQWRKEQREKRKKKPDPPKPAGECCACCRHWSPPREDGFGRCGVLMVAVKREPLGPEKGEVVTPQTAMRFTVGEADLLRTTAGYAACMAFESTIDRRESA